MSADITLEIAGKRYEYRTAPGAGWDAAIQAHEPGMLEWISVHHDNVDAVIVQNLGDLIPHKDYVAQPENRPTYDSVVQAIRQGEEVWVRTC